MGGGQPLLYHPAAIPDDISIRLLTFPFFGFIIILIGQSINNSEVMRLSGGEHMARTPKVVEDRREQILDAAMRAFAHKGFTRATNKDIAQEAGITAGLIYHYFENKEAVLKAVIEERSPLRLIRSFPQEMQRLPPQTFLPLLIRQVLQIVESDNFVQVIRVILPEAIHNPAIAPLAVNVLQEAIQFLSDYLSAKMECGELRRADALLAAQTLINSVIGFVLRRQILHDPLVLLYNHEQIVDSVVTTALYGLLPR
jgi:AcrR family transcriptional regulator